MLFREQLRGHHDGGLIAVLDREHCREERDDGLSASDFALKEALHATIAAHVGDDLADRSHLCTGQLVRERLAETRGELAPVDEGDATTTFGAGRLRPLMQKGK